MSAETTATIVNDYGVLARQAAWLVYCASKFDSEIYLKSNGKIGDAKSILSIEAMELAEGDKVTITADGSDAEEAAAKVKEIIDSFEDGLWWSDDE